MPSKCNYVGLSCSSHDSALAIVRSDGEIAFAEGTERWIQSKRALNIAPDGPFRIREILEEHCEPDARIVAAFTWSERYPQRLQQQLDGSATPASRAPTPGSSLTPIINRAQAMHEYFTSTQLLAARSGANALEYAIRRRRDWPAQGIERRSFDHHRTHAAAACFSSPFAEAACAVLDGYGETGASAAFSYDGADVRELPYSATDAPLASLGMFYLDVCEACGFDALGGEEWKTMGLASYGRVDERLYRVLRRMIGVDGLRLTAPEPAESLALRAELRACSRRRGQRAIDFANLAHTGQLVFEETLYAFLRNLHAAHPCDNLVLTGGCGLNSSANGKILSRTPFKNLFLNSAPADDGNAIGAALLAYREDHPDFRPARCVRTPYLGSRMSTQALERLTQFGCRGRIEDCGSNAPERAAALLARGAIVGWLQDRAEFGPRALGNRSILADARDPGVRERLNSCVKFREEFRPFAPAILHEFGPEYFHDYQESPYMERTLRFREEAGARVPGAVHVDGTGRLQTVKQQWNERFHELLSCFYQRTGTPLLINTSYNVMGKPIAHSVEDAIAVFFTSGIDALFIDDILILK